MWSVDELVGLEFKGFFQVNQEWRESIRKHRNKLKKESPEHLAEYDKAHIGISDTEDSLCHRPIDFKIKMLRYKPDSGLFIAEGHDFFGESGLVGEIINNEIKFIKIYSGNT